jgi:hypothetical protein
MKKHGAYEEPGDGKSDRTINLYWMGEEVDLEDFNERLMNQFKSAAKDLDWMLKGTQLTEQINEGEKTVAQLEELEKIAKLPLCEDCRKLIGEMPK